MKRTYFGKEKKVLGKDRRLVRLTLFLEVTAQANSLPRLQNGPSEQAEWRDLVVTDRKDQVVPKHLVEAGGTKVGDGGYRQSRMER